jgi:hypothetical protein
MNDFIRSSPNSKGAILFKTYTSKIQWIFKDILTYPHFNDEVRKGIRSEIESDAFTVIAINDKIPLLNSEQREMLEGLVEDMLQGKTITISIKTKE